MKNWSAARGILTGSEITALITVVTISAVFSMHIQPENPSMGSTDENVSLICDTRILTDGFSSVMSLQISRRRSVEFKYTLLATISKTTFRDNEPLKAYINEDVAMATREGVWVDGALATGHERPSELILRIASSNLLCTDQAEYQCNVVYFKPDAVVDTRTSVKKLEIFVPPKNLTLSVRKHGRILHGGTEPNPTYLHTNDVIEIQCTGSIGSDQTKTFTWLRTSRNGSKTIPYSATDPGDEIRGEVSSVPIDCAYVRTSKLQYTISTEDANRKTLMAFQCEVAYFMCPLGRQTVRSSPYYILVKENASLGAENSTSYTETGGTSVLVDLTTSTNGIYSEYTTHSAVPVKGCPEVTYTATLVVGVVEGAIILGLTIALVLVARKKAEWRGAGPSFRWNNDASGTQELEAMSYEDLAARPSHYYEAVDQNIQNGNHS